MLLPEFPPSGPAPLRFVGAQQFRPAEGDHRVIATVFDCARRGVPHAATPGRMVGFESAGPLAALRFFGIEVDRIESVPDGMVAWELTDNAWTIWHREKGRDTVLWQEAIAWRWLDGSGAAGATGEFVARGPADPADPEAVSRPPARFEVFARVPYDPRRAAEFADEVCLVDYNPAWPAQAAEMAAWLRERLGPDVALRVEHYGSTAIPGMTAKPVIDLLVEVPSFDAARRRALARLNEPTWEYWRYSDHLVFFKRREPMGERTHHVHLAPRGHAVWQGLAFRDRLRAHGEDAARYAALKRRLAAAHRDDREAYTDAKTGFVREIARRA